MFVEERQSAIMEELHANGKVKVKELSERFSVSEDLIRKDLSALEAKGLLKKAYGGAVLIRENIHRKIAAQRKDVNQEEKRGIAKAAVDLIQEGDVVFLDISTVNIRVLGAGGTGEAGNDRYQYAGGCIHTGRQQSSCDFHRWRIRLWQGRLCGESGNGANNEIPIRHILSGCCRY